MLAAFMAPPEELILPGPPLSYPVRSPIMALWAPGGKISCPLATELSLNLLLLRLQLTPSHTPSQTVRSYLFLPRIVQGMFA